MQKHRDVSVGGSCGGEWETPVHGERTTTGKSTAVLGTRSIRALVAFLDGSIVPCCGAPRPGLFRTESQVSVGRIGHFF